MDNRKLLFLNGVLGADGAQALQKAAARSPAIESAIVPRAILAWLSVTSRFGYEGEIPGVEGTYIRFAKSENDTFHGAIGLGGDMYSFEGRALLHVAGAVAVSLGHESGVHPQLRDVDASRLGKSIDLLVKAQLVTQSLSKATPGGQERPGPAHAPTAADDKQAPTPPQKAPSAGAPPKAPERPIQAPPKPLPKVQIPSIPGLPKVGILKSQAERKCPMCRKLQFSGDEFVGCFCFRGMAKSVKAEATATGYTLTFEDWDKASIKTLLEAMGVR